MQSSGLTKICRDFRGIAFFQGVNFKSVHLSHSLNAARKVPADVRTAVTNVMLKLHENPALIDMLTELGTAQFVKTNAAEIAGNERMLRRVFGYPKQAPESAAKPVAPITAAPVKK